MILMGDGQAFPKFPKQQVCDVFTKLKEAVKDEIDFLHVDKDQNFLKVNFNTLGIKVSYKVDIIIITGHDQAVSNFSK